MYIKNPKICFSYRLFFLILCGFSIISHFSLTDEYNNEKMFSFFTIQSTIFCFIVFLPFTVIAYKKIKDKVIFASFNKWILLKEMATHAILITFLSYRYVLRGKGFSMYSIQETSLFFKDISIHFILPILVFLDYLLFQEKGLFHFRDCLYNLIFPFFYLFFLCIRNLSHNSNDFLYVPKYPYFFLDIEAFGIKKVLSFIFVYFALILLLGILIVFADHLFAKAQKT